MAEDSKDLPEDGEDKGDHEVGYGKPPKAHRFRPGQSGNPRGRRKGQPNSKTFTEQELSRRQWVTVDGKRRQVSNREIMVLAQINKARKGDDKAFRILLELDEGLRRDTDAQLQSQNLSPEEREIIQRHVNYVRKKRTGNDHE